MRNLQDNYARLPFTLTLSRGERGQPLVNFLKFGSHGAGRQSWIGPDAGNVSPLSPKGEGRGEGKRGLGFEIQTN